VEDAEMVRKLTESILSQNGYKVLEARDGHEALRVCQEYPEPIHLLLTDVVMPGLSGRELAEQLALSHPKMKILYMSGYTDDTIIHHGLLEPGTAFLQKPFSPAALTHKLREVLDTAG
jgi:two-component system cell cycle sensor histidine kinase/response regulator CckA